MLIALYVVCNTFAILSNDKATMLKIDFIITLKVIVKH